ncbi:MAG: efflux RND transporter periplasmic adaptor subunit [Deltaproteobacteria bacterium]|nr:efflux RND transporter periplasmic adaptor subunit [Deltaproteobacteria bacterium]
MRRVVLTLPLLLAACPAPDKPAGAAPAAAPPPAAKVRVAPAEARALEDAWRFLGEVRASARASLAAGAAGAVNKVRVRVGDHVTRGQLLVEVDPDLAAARVATAQAQIDAHTEDLAQARREVDRLSGLRANVVPEVERERAQSKVRSLEAQQAALQAALQEAEANLALHRVRAPFDGVVAERRVDPGDWVQAGTPALELVATEDLEIIVDANRALLGHVQPGDPARLLGRGEAEARVDGVVPALDPVSRTLRVRVTPTAPAAWLLPGDSVEVEFKVALTDEGLVVPNDALIVDPTETRVVKVVDGKAAPLKVEVLAKAKGTALVRADELHEGDQVVTRGNERLRAGQPVEVSE